MSILQVECYMDCPLPGMVLILCVHPTGSILLLNGRRVSKTANDLHIHRNTMINRINIINGVLGTDIDTLDEEAVVHYLISLLIEDSDVIPK